MGKRVEVERRARSHGILLVATGGSGTVFSLVQDLGSEVEPGNFFFFPVIINKTELPTCLGWSGSGTTSTPNPEHHPLLPAPS